MNEVNRRPYMKKIALILCLASICLSLSACGSNGGETSSAPVNTVHGGTGLKNPQNSEADNPGRVDKVKVTIGESDKFSKEEIEAAVEVIKNEFKNGFQGCELNEISYKKQFDNPDDYVSYKEDSSGKKIDKENVIRLSTDFTVDAIGASPALNAGNKYTYSWTLIRDSKDSGWKIDDAGQG